MEVDADTMKDVDWRISLLQDAMDEATHKLTLRLSGVLFNEPRRAGPHLINEAFDIPLIETTPVTSQLISPGKQIQGLCTLSGRLRDIIEERNPKRHKEALETLQSIDRIPILLRQLNYQMKRQLWRLQDLRDGDGLGSSSLAPLRLSLAIGWRKRTRLGHSEFYSISPVISSSEVVEYILTFATQSISWTSFWSWCERWSMGTITHHILLR
ncbi:hypothetical protein BC826DRAFT_110547 [Russula brevipes]|nr:hypothetical protein BC826DRAFT_110547 [Russula brevipes]